MLKRPAKVILFLILNLFVITLAGQEYNLCNIKNIAFKSGEKLTYSIYYNWNFLWIPAGTLNWSVYEERDEYVIEVTGKTYESYNWFFEVDDYYTGRIDKNTLLPKWYYRDIREGDYLIRNEIDFNRRIGMIRSEVQVNSKDPIHKTFKLEGCIHDLISLSYNLRNIDKESFEDMGMMMVKLVFDEDIYEIPFRYDGEEKQMKIKNLGTFDAIRVSPDLIAGNVFKEGSEMMIWVSDDSNKIPLMVETPIKVGSIKAVLKNYENIRDPLMFEKNLLE